MLINGGLGAGSQMRNLNAMFRRLLLRGKDEEDASPRKKKKPGTIKVLSPIQALTYLSQAERAANVGSDFVSELTFAGGQGASTRTYAVDSIEVQIEASQHKVEVARRKEADAKRKRAKANWHLALELITTGGLIKNKQVMTRVSPKVSSLWKWRRSCEEDAPGWRPTTSFVQSVRRKFSWANPAALQLVNIPSQVTTDEVSTALLDSLRQEPKIQSKLVGLRANLEKDKTDDVKAGVQQDISEAEAALLQAIVDDKKLHPPIVSSVKTSTDKWIAYVQVPDAAVQEQIMRSARSSGIVLKSNRTIPHIQSAIDKATEKLKQAEAAFNVHPCRKNKEEKVDAQKQVEKARSGLMIVVESAASNSVNVAISVALRCRGRVHKSKTALCESTAASIVFANETLELTLPRLRDAQSNLDRLMRVLEKQGNRPNYLSQKSG